MKECEHLSETCHLQPNYATFDAIVEKELRLPYSAAQILNESTFCVGIPLDLRGSNLDVLSVNEYLAGIKRSVGLYHIWIDMEEECSVHKMHRMLAVYVGKGTAEFRLKNHIKEKWPKTETIYISFFECENRVSKYLEQLFLDLYKFQLNTNENPGQDYLHGLWDAHRYDNGTETHRLGEILARKLYPEEDWNDPPG